MFGVLADIAMKGADLIVGKRRQEDAQDFAASESQEGRDWQERMSNTAMQRRVNDLQLAGLNPMLAFQEGASSPSAAIGSAGIASPTPSHSIQSGMTSATQAKLMQSQADKTDAEKDLVQAQADEVRARTPTHAVNIEQMQQQIVESKNRIIKILQEAETSAATATNIAQQTRNLTELIPQIRATVENLRAHTRLAGAQTTLATAQTAEAQAHTGKLGAETSEISQRVSANLPKLEAALMQLERVHKDMQTPGRQHDEAIQDSAMGALLGALRAINPFTLIVPTIPTLRTQPKPEPGRKDWKK